MTIPKEKIAERLKVLPQWIKIEANVEEDGVSILRFRVGFNSFIAVCKEGEEPQIYQRLGNDTYYSIFWLNPTSKKSERYTASNHKEAQELIDFYHFSKARTRIYLDDGRDMTDDFYFNPKNNDTLKN